MKLLVCVSKTPETTAKISFSDNNTEFDTSGVQFIMNPYDEWYALVRALELKEANGGTVTAINVGPVENEVIIRKALALGADDAVRVNKTADTSFDAATQIAEHARGKGYDMILLGKETIDYNGSEVGAMVAEMLDLPFLSYVSHLDANGTTYTVSRDIEGGAEVSEVSGPIVISGAKGLAEQRIAKMKDIMMSKRKKIEVVEPVSISSHVQTVSYELPPAKSGVKLIDPDNMAELVRLLHEEAKVI